MGKLSLIVFLVFAMGQYSLSQAACNIPSQFWCDNPEVAADCGVTEQCEAVNKPPSKTKMVQFALYYESMCPACKAFITTQLYPAYQKLGSIMNVTLVPYGNAKWFWNSYIPFKWWFECQHGVDECKGNIIETCAINIYKDVSVHFPFIHCIEASTSIPATAAVECAKQHKLNHTKIMELVNSEQGHSLERDMGVETDGLKPKHTYVPWVTLNGVHTEGIQRMAMKNLVKLICKTYTGSPKPHACSEEDDAIPKSSNF